MKMRLRREVGREVLGVFSCEVALWLVRSSAVMLCSASAGRVRLRRRN